MLLFSLRKPTLGCADKIGFSVTSSEEKHNYYSVQTLIYHISFVLTNAEALDKDTVWLKLVKHRCGGIAAWAQVGPKSEHKGTEEEND